VAVAALVAAGGCMESQRGRVTGVADGAGPPDAREVSGEVDAFDASASPDTADAVPEVDAAELGFFGGGWIIDQPFHALYEASFYRLAPDGRVELVASTPSGCTGHLERFCETGHVSPPNESVLCRFGGGTWEEREPLELSITTTCDDGQTRTVVLDFSRFDPVVGGAPKILEVSGQKGWRHASWDWFFRRCEADLQFGFEPVRCR
jgi:hypothetical protein